MSNGGRFPYTADQTIVHFSQFSKAMELTRERQRRPELVTKALQVIIGDEDIIAVPKTNTTSDGRVFHVTTTDRVRSAAAAIKALDCPVKWGLAESPAKIPMVVQPVDCMVHATRLDRALTTEWIYDFYPKIVGPAEFFAFGAKFPDQQHEAMHFTVWLDAGGNSWSAVLSITGRQRYVSVYPGQPDYNLYGCCRLLIRE